jgi:hypothetical protein
MISCSPQQLESTYGFRKEESHFLLDLIERYDRLGGMEWDRIEAEFSTKFNNRNGSIQMDRHSLKRKFYRLWSKKDVDFNEFSARCDETIMRAKRIKLQQQQEIPPEDEELLPRRLFVDDEERYCDEPQRNGRSGVGNEFSCAHQLLEYQRLEDSFDCENPNHRLSYYRASIGTLTRLSTCIEKLIFKGTKPNDKNYNNLLASAKETTMGLVTSFQRHYQEASNSFQEALAPGYIYSMEEQGCREKISYEIERLQGLSALVAKASIGQEEISSKR